MKIVEKFISIQGEGKFTGTPSMFIRTTGCNLRCEWLNMDDSTTKCDTPYTSFNPEKGEVLNILSTVKELSEYKNLKHIVITGGEPLLQNDIESTVRRFVDLCYDVTVETNGTIFKTLPHTTFMSISPKLSGSYNQLNVADRQLHYNNNNFIESVKQYVKKHKHQLKFVINNEDELKEVLQLQKSLNVKSDNIYLMPQGITKQQLNEKNWLVDSCIKYGFNYCNRLHIELWGNKRGV